jgi:hypothetical protein
MELVKDFITTISGGKKKYYLIQKENQIIIFR